MQRNSIAIALLAACLALPSGAPAAAQTFVAVSGDNDNDCSRANPCRTFNGALEKTDAGGLIFVLEAGEYGRTTITKAVTIAAEGVDAVIRATASIGGPSVAITVQAGPADVVILNGIDLEGTSGGGDIGVRFLSGAKLHMRNCVVTRFRGGGAGVGLAIATGAASRTLVSDCVFADNRVGVHVRPTAATAVATLDNVEADQNSTGIHVEGTGAFAIMNRSMVTNNANGLAIVNGGTIFSFGNNAFAANVVSAAPAPIPLQ